MKPSKRRMDTVQIIRLVVQIASFVFVPALFISAYGGIRQLVLAAIHQSFSLASQMPQIVAALAIIPATALMGRFFCGWMCAFGALGDFIYRITGRFVKFRVNEKLDGALKYVKYILLAFLVVACWVVGVKAFSSANPWDAFGLLATVGRAPDFAFVLSNLAHAFVLLVGIVVGSVFVERFFCRYLCPLGAVFAIVSRFRLVKISKPAAKCGKCRVCTKNCAMGISLYKRDTVVSGECIGCMKCVPYCPRGNVSVVAAGSDIRPLAAGAVAVAALAGAYYSGSFALNMAAPSANSTVSMENAQGSLQASDASPIADVTQVDPAATQSAETAQPATSAPAQSGTATPSKPQPTQQPTQAPASASLYKDGTYSGSGKGFRGTTTVSVTIKSDKIMGVKVVSFRDDSQFFNAANSVVPGEILQTQSPIVDAVSGATYSSNGIMAAVADALSKARL
jgi:polyferredoxin/uncharacterized protein with FMN-binding domain